MTEPNPMPDPFVEWLTANNINLNRIYMFPDVAIVDATDPGGTPMIRIESPYRTGDDTRGAIFFRQQAATWWAEYPLIVEPDEDMMDAYLRARKEWIRDQTITQLGRNGCTVIVPTVGDELTLITDYADMDQRAVQILAEDISAAMGCRVAVMTGVHTVIHRRRSEGAS